MPASAHWLPMALAILTAALCVDASSELREVNLETTLVPGPVTVTVLLPPGYSDSTRDYPLLLWLHGGDGDNGFLRRTSPIFQAAWALNETPEMIVVTPDCQRSFYLDYHDGSQKWETFVVTELMDYIHSNYRVSRDRADTFVSGVSMGGMGCLRLALKHPDLFSAAIAFEPGIEPAYEWKDVALADKFYRMPRVIEERLGDPVDEAYWAANNPATIVRDHPERFAGGNLAIYLEVGTEDGFGLYRGAEFLHRTLFDNEIKHEYRYVLGANHVGRSLPTRFRDGLQFLNRARTSIEPDAEVDRMNGLLERLRRAAGLRQPDRVSEP